MNDVERLESLRGRVQHLGTVSIEDTRWLWEMARREVEHCLIANSEPFGPVPRIPPMAPPRKRCRKCGSDGCPACGGSGYQPLENPE